jgi:hypothetical protein
LNGDAQSGCDEERTGKNTDSAATFHSRFNRFASNDRVDRGKTPSGVFFGSASC